MKRTLALLALAGLTLTGCASTESSKPGGSVQTPKTSQAAAASVSATTPAIPDVAGMTVAEAGRVLEGANLKWKLVPMIPADLENLNLEDSEKSTNAFVVDSQNRRLGDTPAEDLILIYASPTQSLIDNVAPWKITCTDGGYDEDSIEDVHNDLASVWKSKNFEDYTDCRTEFTGTKFEPTKAQQKVIDLANVHWEGREEDHYAYAKAIEVCTLPDGAGSGSDTWGDVSKPWLKAAAELCPDAPFYKEMNKWATNQKLLPGNYVVGDDIKAGTYRSSKGTSECYWARSTPGGNIIANNFVNFAASGVTVTVRNGESFEIGDSCGAFEKQ